MFPVPADNPVFMANLYRRAIDLMILYLGFKIGTILNNFWIGLFFILIVFIPFLLFSIRLIDKAERHTND